MNQLQLTGRLAGILLFVCIYAFSGAQSICQTGNEGTTLTLTAPAGKVFISVTFASYGTPNGSCGSFTIGGCHAANSKTIVENALLGNNSASINANNTVFGDPCGGTFKRLYIEAVYGTTLPLKWLSFTAQKQNENVLLQWSTAAETNTNNFGIEYSVNGKDWKNIGTIKSNNTGEVAHYNYTHADPSSGINYYRIRQNDVDGKYSYSEIRTVNIMHDKDQFEILSNPVTNKTLQIITRKEQTIRLFAGDGKLVWAKQFAPGIHSISMNQLNGIYFIKNDTRTIKLLIQ